MAAVGSQNGVDYHVDQQSSDVKELYDFFPYFEVATVYDKDSICCMLCNSISVVIFTNDAAKPMCFECFSKYPSTEFRRRDLSREMDTILVCCPVPNCPRSQNGRCHRLFPIVEMMRHIKEEHPNDVPKKGFVECQSMAKIRRDYDSLKDDLRAKENVTRTEIRQLLDKEEQLKIKLNTIKHNLDEIKTGMIGHSSDLMSFGNGDNINGSPVRKREQSYLNIVNQLGQQPQVPVRPMTDLLTNDFNSGSAGAQAAKLDEPTQHFASLDKHQTQPAFNPDFPSNPLLNSGKSDFDQLKDKLLEPESTFAMNFADQHYHSTNTMPNLNSPSKLSDLPLLKDSGYLKDKFAERHTTKTCYDLGDYFSIRAREREASGCITEKVMSAHGLAFRIEIYADGFGDVAGKFMSVRVRLMNRDATKSSCEITITLRVGDHQVTSHVGTMSTTGDPKAHTYLVFRKFVEQTVLEDYILNLKKKVHLEVIIRYI